MENWFVDRQKKNQVFSNLILGKYNSGGFTLLNVNPRIFHPFIKNQILI